MKALSSNLRSSCLNIGVFERKQWLLRIFTKVSRTPTFCFVIDAILNVCQFNNLVNTNKKLRVYSLMQYYIVCV